MRILDQTKKDSVRDTALQMIVDEGFKGMSMQKLARAAGVSPATLYIYYKDRQDMLNQLYLYIFDASNTAALKGFDPHMPFAVGLQVLWLNRFRYFIANPLHYLFMEQFINSPLTQSATASEDKTYSISMRQFYTNAKNNGQVRDLPVEIYWSVAFAPLYQLIKFHLQKGSHPLNRKGVNEEQVLQCLDMVIKALQ